MGELWALVAGLLVATCGGATGAGEGALQIRDGYLWNPETGSHFLARGPAYQVWNPPVFANQSFDQVDYDLRQFVKLRANSVRAELVWGELQIGPGEADYDWRRADFLIQRAEDLGLKLFLLIGYQYPPSWFPEEHRGINDRGTRSDVLNYESPQAQEAYARHIKAVVLRYRNSPAIGAWIIGNEFAYFDLWEDFNLYPARRMLGYDPVSQAAYRDWLKDRYQDDIALLNANWNSSYSSFAEVVMPQSFPEDRNDPGYHDLIQWRKRSIGKFLALGAKAARENDPNHLISYSMVGGIFTGRDANNTCEDPETIVNLCAEAGAPLDFWSVNNYAWASEGSELRTADFGIAKYKDRIGLPVMLSETGHTSTDNFNPEAAARQAEALPTSLWETLSSGAIGIHFFHWNDRNNFTEDYFLRERGFGIVNQDRTSKGAVFDKVEALFRRMEEIDIADLLVGSKDPDPDILFYLTPEGDIGFPRANQEQSMLSGALRRLGYQVKVIGPEEMVAGEFGGAKALALPRCEQLKPEILDRIEESVIRGGIHVHADADLPGQFNAYRQPNPNWEARMESIFGLDVRNARAAWNGGVSQEPGTTYRVLTVNGVREFGLLPADYSAKFITWKIWHGVRALEVGDTILTHSGVEGHAPGSCALQFRDHGTAKAALNTYALADIHATGDALTPQEPWDIRTAALGAIYRDYFEMEPTIRLTGSKAQYVVPDYRVCRNGSILISLLNEHVSPVDLTLHAPGLFKGKTVERLRQGGILETDSDGKVDLSLPGDGYALLYVYDEKGGADGSLINATPYRVWFASAPQVVWPSISEFGVELGFDTRGEELEVGLALESTIDSRRTYGRSGALSVSGSGMTSFSFPVLDSDDRAPDYRSTPDGGRYQLRASLMRNGITVAESSVPVRLVWGVRPRALPSEVVPGTSYDIEIEWEELPGFLPGEAPTSIDRAELFLSTGAPDGPDAAPVGAKALTQHYNIVLELRDAAEAVVASHYWITREATGSRTFTIDVPGDASGPFHWYAYTETAEGASMDVFESFEGWQTGEAVPFGNPGGTPNPNILSPWIDYTYTQLPLAPVNPADPNSPPANPLYQNHGIHIEGSHGSQSIFYVLHNHVAVGDFSGFGVLYLLDPPRTLPTAPAELQKYRLSFDYREEYGRPTRATLQLKDQAGEIIFLDPAPIAGPAGWHTISGTLDEFKPADWLPEPREPFNFAQVAELICDLGLQEQVALDYLGRDSRHLYSIDNIHFDGPEQLVLGGSIDAIYDSRNDSLPDTDGDGIADVHESGSGIFNGDEDTGTNPNNPDSDGDGQSDGAELVSGTDPNSAVDSFTISVGQDEGGDVAVSWFARAGRRYVIEFSDPLAASTDLDFVPLPRFVPLEVAVDARVSVKVSRPAGIPVRLFRVVGWRKSR